MKDFGSVSSRMRFGFVVDLLLQLIIGSALVLIIYYSFYAPCRVEHHALATTRFSRDPADAKIVHQRRQIEKLQSEIAELEAGILEAKARKEAIKKQASTASEQAIELDVIPWDLISETAYYLTETSQMGMTAHVYTSPFAERKRELKSLVEHSRTLMTDLADAKHISKAAKFTTGHVRFHPILGTDALMAFNGEKGAQHVLHAVRRFYAPAVIKTTALKKDSPLLHMVMPLAGRLVKLEFFLETFVRVYKNDPNLYLTVVYFGADGLADAQKLLKDKLAVLAGKKPVYRILRKDLPFSRGGGLQHGAKSDERWPISLDRKAVALFFIDVDILFDNASLRRCRLLPVRGKRVYYPIVFSHYNPENAYRHLDDIPEPRERTDHVYSSGLWRAFGFGMSCLHYDDFISSGGFDLDIKGWGAEDVLLYRKFLKRQPKVAPMRAIDRGLFHIFHEKTCDKTLNDKQMQMCQGSRGISEATHEQMGYLIYN